MVPSQTVPDLGVRATVIFDHETHAPTTLNDEREGLRNISVLPGESEDFYVDDVLKDGTDNMVLALDSEKMTEQLVDEIHIVSTYSLHVALYALQNPTPQNIARALQKIAVSGDCEEASEFIDGPTNDHIYAVAKVPPPPGWDEHL